MFELRRTTDAADASPLNWTLLETDEWKLADFCSMTHSEINKYKNVIKQQQISQILTKLQSDAIQVELHQKTDGDGDRADGGGDHGHAHWL